MWIGASQALLLKALATSHSGTSEVWIFLISWPTRKNPSFRPGVSSRTWTLENKPLPRLADLMNSYNDFTVTPEMAEQVLATEANEFFVENHSYLGAETFPKINDFKSFYVYGEENRADLMGRVMARQQHTVWGTGTHTDTPVGVFIYGPRADKRKFDGFMTHPEVGAALKKVVSRY